MGGEKFKVNEKFYGKFCVRLGSHTHSRPRAFSGQVSGSVVVVMAVVVVVVWLVVAFLLFLPTLLKL